MVINSIDCKKEMIIIIRGNNLHVVAYFKCMLLYLLYYCNLNVIASPMQCSITFQTFKHFKLRLNS